LNVSLEDVVRVVRGFVQQRKGSLANSLTAESALLRDGYTDSFGLIELIGRLEKELSIDLPDGSLIPEQEID
jgi:acyl carrier protein